MAKNRKVNLLISWPLSFPWRNVSRLVCECLSIFLFSPQRIKVKDFVVYRLIIFRNIIFDRSLVEAVQGIALSSVQKHFMYHLLNFRVFHHVLTYLRIISNHITSEFRTSKQVWTCLKNCIKSHQNFLEL